MLRQTEKGITLTGFIIVAIIICVMGLLVMRIAPVYIQHYQVLHAAKALKNLPKDDFNGPPPMVKMHLMSKLMNQLYVNMIEDVKRKNVKIKYKRKKYIIEIKYSTERPLVANIRLLFDFDSTVEVATGGT